MSPIASAGKSPLGAVGAGTMVCLGLVLLAAALPAAPAPTPAPVAGEPAGWLPLDEIEAGQTGYGLTVFNGTEVDTFGVRVLGIQHAVRAGGSLILVELSGHDLDLTAVARGMSGSPVFLKGRFAGAVAFGWSGALRPIAGLTPAEEMMRLPLKPVVGEPSPPQAETGPAGPDAPRPRSLGAGTSPPLPPWVLLAGAPRGPGAAGLAAALRDEGQAVDAPAAAAGPAAAARLLGLPDPAVSPWPSPRELGEALVASPASGPAAASEDGALPFGLVCRPLGAGVGAGDPAGAWPTRLVPGAACAVALVTGDAQLGALGTTTWVDGDRVLMMGHPLMQRGAVTLALASARILGIFPSRDSSFKLGDTGPVIGTVHYDLRAGLVGQLGQAPPLSPVAVRLDRGGEPESYDFAVARDPGLTPGLVFWCLYNSLLVRGDDLSEQTISYHVQTRWREPDGGPLTVELQGAVAGPGTMMDLATQWMAPVQMLVANRHLPLTLDGVEARIEVRPELATSRIVAVQAAGTAEPGQVLPVTVVLEPHRQGVRELSFEVPLPAHLAPGSYRLAVAGAQDFFALENERAAGRFQDRSLTGLLELVREPRSAGRLVVAVLGPPGGVTVAGRELPDLPPSVAGVLARSQERVDTLAASYVARVARDTDRVLEGSLVQELRVLPSTRPIRQEERP